MKELDYQNIFFLAVFANSCLKTVIASENTERCVGPLNTTLIKFITRSLPVQESLLSQLQKRGKDIDISPGFIFSTQILCMSSSRFTSVFIRKLYRDLYY